MRQAPIGPSFITTPYVGTGRMNPATKRPPTEAASTVVSQNSTSYSGMPSTKKSLLKVAYLSPMAWAALAAGEAAHSCALSMLSN
jgi:hypothetical protein